MWKKSLFLIGIIGVLLIVAGLIFNPDLLARFSSTGAFRSEWTVAKIHLIRYYMIIIGTVLVLGYLIISRFSKENRNKHLLLGLGVIGIVISIVGVIFSPSFVEYNFSSIKFLEDQNMETLVSTQLLTISVGFLIVLFSLLAFRRKYINSSKGYSLGITVIVLVLYFIFINATYIKLIYPASIILKPGEYHKVLDLLLGQDILLSDFEPKSTLTVKRHQITKAKYPVIDINFHMNSEFKTEYDKKVLSAENFIKSMDSVGVRLAVNLDGVGEGISKDFLVSHQNKYPNKFRNFYPLWFPPTIIMNDHIIWLASTIEKLIKNGETQGIKIWKYLGLRTRDSLGKVIPVDDPRLSPIWDKVSEYGIPVVWHMGDPAAFFTPIDKFNERFIELGRYSQWSFYGSRFPSRETILKGRENVIKQHPDITFIGAHMGMNAEDLSYIGYLLDTYPNYYIETSTVLSELGRQPYTAREFFIKYQDRILFGTDGGSLFGVKGWSVTKFYLAYFEFLETNNEYIDYPMQGAIDQGDWKIYGINLPDEVLEKIYYKNAEKILKVKIQ